MKEVSLTDRFKSQQFWSSKQQAMVPIQINTMIGIIQIIVCSLLFSVVTGKPCVFCLPTPPTEGLVRGNLKLHYIDGSTLQIDYDSSILDCTRKDLADKIITRVEATSANFILYSKAQWRGRAKPVSWGNYSARLGFPNMKVRSIKQRGCRWPSSGVSLVNTATCINNIDIQ